MNIFKKLIAVIIMVSVVSSLGLVGVADTATSNACDYFLNNKYRINSKVSCGDCYGLRLYSFSNGKFTVTGNSTVQERMGKSNAFSTYNSTKEHSYQCTVEVIKLLSVGSPSISASGFSSGVSVNTKTGSVSFQSKPVNNPYIGFQSTCSLENSFYEKIQKLGLTVTGNAMLATILNCKYVRITYRPTAKVGTTSYTGKVTLNKYW